MHKQERISITKALWQIALAAGVTGDTAELVCHTLEGELEEYDVEKSCPRCGNTMRAPSLVDNGKWNGALCARCAKELDPTGWYLESGDQQYAEEAD